MKIPQEIIDELISQARQDAPNETCGYLLGTSGPEGYVVTEHYWMENIDHSSEHFSFAPKDQFAALRYAPRPRAPRKKICVWLTTPTSATPSSRSTKAYI